MKNAINIFAAILMATCALLICTNNINAAKLVVDNSGFNPNNYPDYASAEMDANSGDTIYLSPTGLPYGALTITKSQLRIFGGGNGHPDLPARTITNNITVSAVDSIEFNGIYILGNINGGSNEYLSISNCSIVGSITNVGNGSLFRNNILVGSFSSCVGVNISNNIISTNFTTMISCTFANNLIYERTNTWFFNNLQNSIVTDNIMFYDASTVATSITTSFIDNNIFEDDAWLSAAGATSNNIVEDSLFVFFPPQSTDFISEFLYDWDLTYIAGNSAEGAGTGGSDIGPFGGNYPMSRQWLMYANPYPLILDVQINNGSLTLPSGGFVPINIKASNIVSGQ